MSKIVSLITLPIFAQSIVIKGTVKDLDGNILPGARVEESGTTNFTIADADGKYVIMVQPGANLAFSMLGFETLFFKDEGKYKTVNVELIKSKAYKRHTVLTGYVKDLEGNLIPGVRVTEKKTSNFTETDENGYYKIVVKRYATLVFSKSNYVTLDYKDNGEYNTVNITLKKTQ